MSGGGGPTSVTNVPPSILPPDYPLRVGLSRDVLPNLVGAQMPSYQQAGGQFGGAPSPTEQAGMHSLQQWATAPPQFMSGVQGTLGNLSNQSYVPGASDFALNNFLAPSSINPMAQGPMMPQGMSLGGAGPFAMGGGMMGGPQMGGPMMMGGGGPQQQMFTPPGMGMHQMGGQMPGGAMRYSEGGDPLNPDPFPGSDISDDPNGGYDPFGTNFGADDPLGNRFRTGGLGSLGGGGASENWIYPQFNSPGFAGYGVANYTPMDPGNVFSQFDPSAGVLPMGFGMSQGGLWGTTPMMGMPEGGYMFPSTVGQTGLANVPFMGAPNPDVPAQGRGHYTAPNGGGKDPEEPKPGDRPRPEA